MNKRLDQVLTRLKSLPDEEQDAAADFLVEYLDARQSGDLLTPEQIAEIERRLANPMLYATADEVRIVFNRLTK